MKANALEKIYISPGLDRRWYYPEKVGCYDTEYIRTDAFIEKACDAYCKVCGHYSHTVPTHICRHDCRYFSDFEKYMKGE